MEQPHPSVGQLPSYTSGSPFKGFWIRLVAFILDTVIVISAAVGLALLLGIVIESLLGPEAVSGFIILALLGFIIASLLYKPLMEGSDYQGTIGKYILGMKVVDASGGKIKMSTSFIRTLVYLVQTSIPGLNAISWLAFVMIGFTERKQGLHDFAADTFVVAQYWTAPISSQDGFGS
jgi:uncharacterized RDD family membrane protein YckC